MLIRLPLQIQLFDKVINVLFLSQIPHHELNDIYVHFLIYGLLSKIQILFLKIYISHKNLIK